MATRETERACWLCGFLRWLRRALARVRAVAATGLFPDKPEVGTGPAKVAENRTVTIPEPDPDKVIWLWNQKWRTIEKRQFLPIETTIFTIDKVLVLVGLIHSRSEAQRLLKAGAVSWRRDDTVMDWTKITDFRQELEAGWPWVLRISDGHWRTVQVTERPDPAKPPETKPKGFPGLALVMRPELCKGVEEDGVTPWEMWQTRDVWSDLWRQP